MKLETFTAGESHGKGIMVLIRGFPSGLTLEKEAIEKQLRRRQGGYGRGGRMEIERDEIEVLSGFYQGKSMGTPIVFWIKNEDWPNWEEFISPEQKGSREKKLTLPRPGHGDLAGALKHGFRDCRKVLERTSARETAGRVAAAGLFRSLLREFGIEITSRVTAIGGIEDDPQLDLDDWSLAEESPVRVIGDEVEREILDKIDLAKKQGDSLGGVFQVRASGVPPGLGNYSDPGKKLDGKIAAGFMSIPGIKSVEIGQGKKAASEFGSEVHDEIYHDQRKGFYRTSNSAGGIEGGVTNGEPIGVTAGMKPIPTLAKPLHSVDLVTGLEGQAAKERSDVCAVPAASIVGEGELANVVAEAFLDKFGGDTLEEIRESFDVHRERVANWFREVQK